MRGGGGCSEGWRWVELGVEVGVVRGGGGCSEGLRWV